MSEQEIAAAMNAADASASPDTNAEAPVVESAPVAAPASENEPQQFVPASDCVKVYDYVTTHEALIHNWKKTNLSLTDGTAVADTQEVLVGVDNKNIPFSFNCKNLLIPNAILEGATEIKVFVSGIIIYTPTISIYISKNNIFSYVKNTDGRTVDSYVYYKLRGDKVNYKRNSNGEIEMGTAERAKLEFKVSGGRIYGIIQNMADVNEIRTAILSFLKDKVVDINYCIKIENLCHRCGF